MCSVPNGYGSISSWYQWFAGSSPGGGLGVWKVCSSSQTRCHFASIFAGSYLSILGPETKKPLVREAVGSWRGVATFASWTTREAPPSTKMVLDGRFRHRPHRVPDAGSGAAARVLRGAARGRAARRRARAAAGRRDDAG